MKILAWSFSRYGGWVRLFGRGIGFRTSLSPPLFSERNGYVKVWRVLGLRFSWLPALVAPASSSYANRATEVRQKAKARL